MTVLDEVNPYVLGQHRKSLSELRQELESARDRGPAAPAGARGKRTMRHLFSATPVLASVSGVICVLVLGAVALLLARL